MHPERQRQHSFDSAHRRRAERHGVNYERVVRAEVYERYFGRCGICGGDVGEDEFEVDHIVPIARGGTHTLDNCQPAHALCNKIKSDRIL